MEMKQLDQNNEYYEKVISLNGIETLKKHHQLKKQHGTETNNQPLKNLQDQVIVITGASSGVGLVTARMAVSRGAKVVLASRSEEALKELSDELCEKGYPIAYVKADVGREEDINKIAKTAINAFGHFDTWVNNAGVSIFGYAMDVSIEDMKRMHDTNFWGVVYGSRVAVKHFKDRDVPGALINVGSLFGDRGTLIQSTYAPSKFAVHGWTESLRMELEKEKVPVSVTLIHPGRIDTPYAEHAKSYLDKQPTHRGMIYPPDAVAEAILYAAEHPKRDMYIGSQAKGLELMGTLFPRFTDKIMKFLFPQSQYKNKPSKPRDENGLNQPGYSLQERGKNVGWIRSQSFYVKASKNRALSPLILAGLGALVWAEAKRRK